MSDFSLELPISAELPHWPTPMKVTVESPYRAREAAELLGLYFKRECHFDSPPMKADEQIGRSDFQPYEVYLPHEFAHDLLAEDEPVQHRAIGACGLRRITRN